jgi:hypothetical protein
MLYENQDFPHLDKCNVIDKRNEYLPALEAAEDMAKMQVTSRIGYFW